MFVEEPVPQENIDALKQVSDHVPFPIATGERLLSRWEFRQIFEKQAVAYIQPDVAHAGGITELKKIANMAEIYYIPFAPHNVSSPVGTLASAHVCATVPNFLILEYHWLHRDYWSTIIQEKTDIIKDGFIQFDGRPGIGVELDEEVGRQYQYPGTTWFE